MKTETTAFIKRAFEQTVTPHTAEVNAIHYVMDDVDPVIYQESFRLPWFLSDLIYLLSADQGINDTDRTNELSKTYRSTTE